MKTLIFTLYGLFCFSIIVYAQNPLDLQLSKRYQSRIHDIDTKDTRLFIGGSDNICGRANVSYWSQEGEQLWYTYPFGDYGAVLDVLVSEVNDDIYVAGNFFQVDILTEEPGRRIARLDSLGNVLNVNRIGFTDYNHRTKMTMTQLRNGEILLGDASQIFWISETGDSLDMKTYPEANFVELLTWQDSFVVALATDRMYVLDSEGVVLDSVVTEDMFFDMIPSEDDFYILSTDKIYQYQPDVQAFSTLTTLDTTLIQADGLLQKDGQFLLWGIEKASQQPTIFRLNTDFSLNDFRLLDAPNTKLQKVIPVFDQLFIAGQKIYITETLTRPSTRQDFIQLRPFEESLALPNADISLTIESIRTDFVPDFIYVEGDSLMMDSVFIVEGQLVPFEVTVTNESSETIHSFILTSQQFVSVNCQSGKYYKRFDDVNLLPGESMFITDEMNVYLVEYSDVDIRIYLNAISPNDFLDGDFSDNVASASVNIVSAPKVVEASEHLQVFPNPTTNHFTIESSSQSIENVFLYDLTGRLVKKVEELNNEQFQWNMEGVSSGIYLLKVQVGEQLFSIKMVKRQ